jgi:predicted nucleotidyltransferase
MDIIKDDLNAIVQKINEILPEAKVYLFGSYATGKQRKDSDLDICVVAPEYKERRMEVLYLIRVAIRGATKLPVDVLAFTNEEFERRSKMKPTIQYAIAKEGVLLNV